MLKPIWERKPEKMLSTEGRDWLAELQEEWNGLQEKAEKLEAVKKQLVEFPCVHIQDYQWMMRAIKRILEAEG